ncbi:MAG: N-acetylmuramoyl-L-alanine amidase, partial [Eubacteriaceae bacterium]|nr:N-acetylmuramoyl-L-alanine amidase [Eubacteriaceae bacterium]
ATDILRTDVTSSIGKGYNYNYCGYRATLPVTAMTQNGTYKISLEFKAGGFVKEVGVNYPSSAGLASIPSKVVGSKLYQLSWTAPGLQITSSDYTPNVKQYVDNVVWKDNALELTGWITLEGVNLSSEASVEKNILVRDSAGNELGRYLATDVLRTDVTSAFGKGYNYNYSGYTVSLPMTAMTSDGNYSICLEFKSGGFVKEVTVNYPSSAQLSSIPGKVVGVKLYQPKWATTGFQIGVSSPKYTVMLDPGHEGKYPFDPGAVNSTLNILEYQLNNQLASKVASQLTANGFKVVYTRNPDLQAAASLEQRADLVNEVKPDLFISIHHDSSTVSASRGFSIHWSSYRYNLDTSGLTVYLSGKAYPFVRQFKQIENSKEETYIVYLDGGSEKTMNIDSDIVVKDSTLCSAAQGSQKFANILYGYLTQLDYIGPRTNPVSDHNLYVTRETNVPSVLFEGGFLSNNTEVQLISNSANQDKFAAKVSAAVVEYFK